MPATQTHRPFRVKTPLGDDALLLESFTGTERVSTPFRFLLKVLSYDPNIDMKGLLNKPAVLAIGLSDGTERYIHGNINRMKLLELAWMVMPPTNWKMVPWLWFLNLFSDCRIFQNMTCPGHRAEGLSRIAVFRISNCRLRELTRNGNTAFNTGRRT